MIYNIDEGEIMVGAVEYRYFNWMKNNDIRLLPYLLFSELAVV
jgi:hypothetical protein